MRPRLLARAATAFHCKDWLYFKLTGERATDPSEGIFTFGDFRTRATMPEMLRSARHRRLRAPAAADGRRRRGARIRSTRRARPRHGPARGHAGRRSAMSTWSAPALGGGLYDPAARVGCSIIGSTGMHMRLAPDADDGAAQRGALPATPCRSRCRACFAQMQSNMAATLNIDWLLDLAREAARSWQGVDAFARRPARPARCDGARRPSRPQRSIIPTSPRLASAGRSSTPDARAQFIGLSTRHGFRGSDARRSIEGLAFAARDCYAAMGALPREVRIAGGAARVEGAARRSSPRRSDATCATAAREEAGAAGAAMIAAVAIGVYPRHDGLRRATGSTPLLGRAATARPGAGRALRRRLFPIYLEARRGHARRSGRGSRPCAAGGVA